MRDHFEEQLSAMIEELREEMEVYESFFKLNDPKADNIDQRVWKAMLEEHKFMKQMLYTLQDQLLRLESML